MRRNIVKLGKKITDCMDVKLGMVKLDESRPEYWMLDALLNDEQADLMLQMTVRKPTTPEALAKKSGWELSRVQRVLDELTQIGFVEYNWHNEDHHKQYVMPVFVVGSCENLILNDKQVAEHPEIAEFFYQMGYQPLKMLSHMVPPGGAGLGFHVIPIESAIPKDSEAIDVERLSYWLKKYDTFAIMPCVCRRSMRMRGEGCGEIEDETCIAVGDYAQYIIETNRGRKATYQEIVDLLQRAEDNGYMHQITNGDGPDHIFAICNCQVGSCYALRCSQLFNAQNLSASAYRAKVDPKNCVACGKCVEVCPAGAARLGQKLCTKDGPIEYPKAPLASETPGWGEKNWNYNYRNDNQKNCYDTGTAPCKTACPAHIAVQGYVKMAAQGRYDEALALIKQDNPFPAVCGSICNRRCEDACTRGKIDAPLAVDEIKKFIARRELNAAHRYVPKKVRMKGEDKDYTEKIAVIGAGPAGMSCAFYLAKLGYPVTVFDRNPVPGGMLTLGIPSFRLEKDVVEAEIDILREMGVAFRCGVEVGKDVTIQQLRDEGYKGFYLAIGAQCSAKLRIPGEDLAGVFGGVDFLREVNLGRKPEIGGRVAVVGGGNVAMDVVRTAIRQGAEEAYILYRRSADELPADPDEVAEALAEGVQFRYLNAPVEILGENGRVTGVKVERMALGEPDERGRRKPVGTGEFETLAVDAVIGAIGQTVDWGALDTGDMVKNKKQLAEADAITYQTAQPDVFVGGDCHTGPKFAIDAIAAGREGAISLHRYVHPGHSLTLARNVRDFKALDKENLALPADSFDKPARQQVRHDARKVRTMRDDRLPFTEEQVKAEASRCLSCGATVVDQNRCVGCGICTTRCQFDAIHLERNHPEFANYANGDDAQKLVVLNGVKRAGKIAIKQMKQAVTGAPRT